MHKKRKASGVHISSRKPTKKCAMKMKVELEEKNDVRVKCYSWKEALYNAQTKNR